MADGKPFSTWLSGELLTKAEARAEETAKGNQSKYVRALIERDVDADPAYLLVDLAKQYHPSVARRIQELFVAKPALLGEFLNHQLVLARMLDALVRAAEENDAFDPTRPFELIDAKKLNEYYSLGDERMEQIAHRVMELQASYGEDSSKSSGRGDAKEAVKAAKLGASSKKSKAS